MKFACRIDTMLLRNDFPKLKDTQLITDMTM